MRRDTRCQQRRQQIVLRRVVRNPEFLRKVQALALPLAPLVRVDTGDVHPDFPTTVLQFWLLTDAQLESLAWFYHQKFPSALSSHYPCPIKWGPSLTLEDKRRKIGKFIGLRGCETPIVIKTEMEILEEARMARLAEDEEMWRRKTCPWEPPLQR